MIHILKRNSNPLNPTSFFNTEKKKISLALENCTIYEASFLDPFSFNLEIVTSHEFLIFVFYFIFLSSDNIGFIIQIKSIWVSYSKSCSKIVIKPCQGLLILCLVFFQLYLYSFIHFLTHPTNIYCLVYTRLLDSVQFNLIILHAFIEC